MSLDFTAIDFETANGNGASVCAVGLAKVRDGKIVESTSWIIQPPTGIDSFQPMNIKIHGITPRMAAKGITWLASESLIREFASEDVLVAFNAPFDRTVYDSASAATGGPLSWNQWKCALVLSRAFLDLSTYRLPDVAGHLDISGLQHHDPASDAKVCAQIIIALAERLGKANIESLWADVEVKPTRPPADKDWNRIFSKANMARKGDLPKPRQDADPGHSLYGQHVIFTGDLSKLDRWTAMEFVALYGGHNGIGVTLKTSVLVVCDEDPHAPGFDLSKGTGKQKKAHDYITNRGQKIQVISEDDFYTLAGISDEALAASVKGSQSGAAAPVEPSSIYDSHVDVATEGSAPVAEAGVGDRHLPVESPAPAELVPADPEPILSKTYPADAQYSSPAMKRRSPVLRGLLLTLAIALLVVSAAGLLFLAVSIAIGQGFGAALFFAITATLFGGGGLLLLRAAKRR